MVQIHSDKQVAFMLITASAMFSLFDLKFPQMASKRKQNRINSIMKIFCSANVILPCSLSHFLMYLYWINGCF